MKIAGAMAKGPSSWPWLWLSVALALLGAAPFARYIGWFGDEGVLLHGATRMQAGEVLYRDFFAFMPPGGYLLVKWWLSAFGNSLPAARALAILVAAATAGAIHLGWGLACRRASPSQALGLALATLWIIVSQGTWTVVSHHAFTTLLSLIALIAAAQVVDRDEPAPALAALAGFCAGLAVMVTQTRGGMTAAVCVLALAFARRSRRDHFALVAGGGSVLIATICWLLAQGTLKKAIECVILWASERYAPIQSVPFGAGRAPQNIPVLVLFPALLVLVIASLAIPSTRRTLLANRQFPLWSLAALAAFVGAYPRPDTVHLAYCAPLALPLFATCASLLVKPLGARASTWLAGAMIVASLPSAQAFFSMARKVISIPVIPSARGGVQLGPDTDPAPATQALARILQIPPGEPIYFYPYEPMLIYLAGRRQPGPYDMLVPGYSTVASYRASCEAAVSRATWVVNDERWSSPALLMAVFPHHPNPSPPEKTALEDSLARSFAEAAKFGPYHIARRRADADGKCTGF